MLIGGFLTGGVYDGSDYEELSLITAFITFLGKFEYYFCLVSLLAIIAVFLVATLFFDYWIIGIFYN